MPSEKSLVSARSGSDSEAESLAEFDDDAKSTDSFMTRQQVDGAGRGSDDSSDDERVGRNTGMRLVPQDRSIFGRTSAATSKTSFRCLLAP